MPAELLVYLIVWLASGVSVLSNSGSGMLQQENEDSIPTMPYTDDFLRPSVPVTVEIDSSPSPEVISPEEPTISVLITPSSSQLHTVSNSPMATHSENEETNNILPSSSMFSLKFSSAFKTATRYEATTRAVTTLASNIIPRNSSATAEVSATITEGEASTQPAGQDEPSTGVLAGIVVALVITVLALVLAMGLLVCLCYCCLRPSKYEYSTGNENRMTIRQWNLTHATMNHSFSLSSLGSGKSHGSLNSGRRTASLFGSLGGLMQRRSDSSEQVTSIINYSIPDMYSTPL